MNGTVENPSYLLVVTCNRTGSTLLMDILNTVPGSLIRGENYDCAYGLFLFWRSIHHPYCSSPTAQSSVDPFFNELDFTKVRASLKSLLRDTLDPQHRGRVVGYKEVHYLLHACVDLCSYLDFLYELIAPRMIYLTRDLEDMLGSAIWRDTPHLSRQRITAFYSAMDTYCAERPGRMFHATYEGVVNRTILPALFDYIGEEYNRPAVERVLSTPHSFDIRPDWSTRGRLPKEPVVDRRPQDP